MDAKLSDLAVRLTYAQGVKDVAKLRSQCDLADWKLVVAEAKRIHHASKVVPGKQAAYRA